MARADASRLTGMFSRGVSQRRVENALLQSVAGAAAAILLGLALLIVARRLSGALSVPLAWQSLLAAGAVLAAVASLIRLPTVRMKRANGRWIDCTLLVAPAPALVAIAAALSLPETSAAALAGLWLLIVVHEAAWLGLVFLWFRRSVNTRTVNRLADAPQRSHVASSSTVSTPAPISNLPEVDDAFGRVMQHIRRATDERGGETIWGKLSAAFAPGERSQSLHVAFCPPLAARPELAVEPVAGPPATFTVAELQSYGARIDVRLRSKLSEAAEVTLKFCARPIDEPPPDEAP